MSDKDEPVRHAVDVVARQAIANASRHIEWGLYPEIGELDWQAVRARISEIQKELEPWSLQFDASMEFLASRAEVST